MKIFFAVMLGILQIAPFALADGEQTKLKCSGTCNYSATIGGKIPSTWDTFERTQVFTVKVKDASDANEAILSKCREVFRDFNDQYTHERYDIKHASNIICDQTSEANLTSKVTVISLLKRVKALESRVLKLEEKMKQN